MKHFKAGTRSTPASLWIPTWALTTVKSDTHAKLLLLHVGLPHSTNLDRAVFKCSSDCLVC